MIFKALISMAFFLIFIPRLDAQRLVTGKILDITTKEKINEVDVAIYKGTSVTTSNRTGYFQLTVKEGDSLLFTHPDYQVGLISIPEADVFIIYLEPVDNYPIYLAGQAKLYEYLQQHLRYPGAAIFKNIEGVVVIQVQVDSAGNMISCKALNDIGGNCARETVEVFEEISGKWSKSDCINNLLFSVVFKIGDDSKEIEMPDIEIVRGKIMDPIFVSLLAQR